MGDFHLLEVYEKDTQVWLQDQEEGWVNGQIISKKIEGTSVYFEIKNDKDQIINQEYNLEKVQTKQVELPPLCNPPILEGIDDLTNLSYLHEPAVLHNIRTRYTQREIYTYSGIVLIACNPFHKVSLYSPEAIKEYSGKSRGELKPHLFAISEDAYRCMIREQQNQTIVVSGESGAGKTVSAKFIMRYFASVKDSEGNDGGSDLSEVEEQILATNPILEAFGNAKTTRNDNSSRFGKYIEILFDKSTNIVGARIRTYLLERSRLIHQPYSERNYHIFYQLCAGASSEEREELSISDYSDFYYLNQGGLGTIAGVDDNEEFSQTRKSLELVGVAMDAQKDIFKILAGVLHLGNIHIGGSEKHGAALDDGDNAFIIATSLLGLDPAEFRKWLMKKQIIMRSERITNSLSPSESMAARDAVSKFIYTNLFGWLIKIINQSLCSETNPNTVASFIGVLDIYGFEHFEKNSFEQFCINYANEKLQQEFNKHVFKLEQEEYIKEDIGWQFIEFSDNQPCINIIEGKLGVLALLDEESRMPKGSDLSLVSKLYKQLDVPEKNAFFKKPKFSNEAFTICHYAHDVTYEVDGFLEKNKDTVSEELIQVLLSTKFSFLKDIITANEEPPSNSPKNGRSPTTGNVKKTLSSTFKGSLIKLMETISSTNVHYIRCIKPNEEKKPWHFDSQMVLSQLRACGVLETIRISCQGYPSRRSLEEFVERYYLLAPSSQWNFKDSAKFCTMLLESTIKDAEKYQLGRTKAFFQAGQLAYLEKLRSSKLNSSACKIQSNIRRYNAQRFYNELRISTIILQSYVRRKQATQFTQRLREEQAAVRIQKNWKMSHQKQLFHQNLGFVLKVQTVVRRYFAVKQLLILRQEKAAITIQKHYRRWAVERVYKRQVQLMVLLQSCIRRCLAEAKLKELRENAEIAKNTTVPPETLERSTLELDPIPLDETPSIVETPSCEDTSEPIQETDHAEYWKEKFEEAEARNSELEAQIIAYAEDNGSLRKENSTLSAEREALVENLRVTEEELNLLKTECTNIKKELVKTKRMSGMTGDSSYESVNGVNGQEEVLNSEILHEDHNSWQSTSTKSTKSGQDIVLPEFRHPQIAALYNEEIASARRATFGTLSGARNSAHTASILESEGLVNEIEELLRESELPIQDGPRSALSRSEILYPAHLICTCVEQFWAYNLGLEMRRLLTQSTQTIESLIMKADPAKFENVAHYWLANSVYLLQGIVNIDQRYQSQNSGSVRYSSDYLDPGKVVIKLKETLEELIVKIYNLLMHELKKRINRLIVPGIIESQPLMEYYVQESGFFKKMMTNARNSMMPPTVKIVSEFLEHERNLLDCYFVDSAISKRIIEELLNYVGASAFNNIVTRRNFCSWKRGTQIQANITQLQEWSSRLPYEQLELQHLDQLRQATKLLTLLNTVQDIDVLFQACEQLSPSQIKKITSLYSVSDYEEPLPAALVAEITECCELSEKPDDILLPVDTPIDTYGIAKLVQKMTFSHTEEYIPDWLQLHLLRYVVAFSQISYEPPTQFTLNI
ncbi:Myosin type-2 heavy chain 1 [Basidiobolus ranarum]|uniref:Myosin type-2 heavy chain 1 n=1 Tax=Basidiobolus ranarum TaxID=34480 RepID=A0ABR2VQ30_9FUNG